MHTKAKLLTELQDVAHLDVVSIRFQNEAITGNMRLCQRGRSYGKGIRGTFNGFSHIDRQNTFRLLCQHEREGEKNIQTPPTEPKISIYYQLRNTTTGRYAYWQAENTTNNCPRRLEQERVLRTSELYNMMESPKRRKPSGVYVSSTSCRLLLKCF